MTPSRPRRPGVRGVVPILALVGIAATGALSLGLGRSLVGVPASPEAVVSASPTGAASPSVAAPVSPTAASTATPTATPNQLSSAPPSAPPISGVQTLTPNLTGALQRRLDALRIRYAMPGISVAIVFPDGTIWAGTSGLAQVVAKVPVTPDTEFAVASVTKTFTSALVLALAREGKIAIDDPVATYVPELHLDPRITVRQLLDHTSGLGDYFFHPSIDKLLQSRPGLRWTETQALRYIGKPYFMPGHGWHYSNTNYLVLGMLAERVGKTTLARQLQARFFDPFHLGHTYYQPTQKPIGPVAHGYRFVAATKGEKAIDLSDGSSITPFTSVITAAAGAGGIASTATDLVTWTRALYSGDVLGRDVVAAMMNDAATTRRYRPRVAYGLGVQLVDVLGHPSLGHSGRLLGFRSDIRWLPDVQVGIAVVSNQSRTDPTLVGKALLRLVVPAPIVPPAGSPVGPGASLTP